MSLNYFGESFHDLINANEKEKGAHSSRIVKQAGSLGELVRRTYDI
jgi:hypothetical protein